MTRSGHSRLHISSQFSETAGSALATHLLEAGYDIRTIQELLGHIDVNTAMIYTHMRSV